MTSGAAAGKHEWTCGISGGAFTHAQQHAHQQQSAQKGSPAGADERQRNSFVRHQIHNYADIHQRLNHHMQTQALSAR